MRKKELLTLLVADLNFELRGIQLRAINAKTNRKREIPMTARVHTELLQLCAGKEPTDFVFNGIQNFKRSFTTLKRTVGITGLNFHDFRHAFVSRSILAGIPHPKGEARLRAQISAAHTRQDLEQSIEAFKTVGKRLGVI